MKFRNLIPPGNPDFPDKKSAPKYHTFSSQKRKLEINHYLTSQPTKRRKLTHTPSYVSTYPQASHIKELELLTLRIDEYIRKKQEYYFVNNNNEGIDIELVLQMSHEIKRMENGKSELEISIKGNIVGFEAIKFRSIVKSVFVEIKEYGVSIQWNEDKNSTVVIDKNKNRVVESRNGDKNEINFVYKDLEVGEDVDSVDAIVFVDLKYDPPMYFVSPELFNICFDGNIEDSSKAFSIYKITSNFYKYLYQNNLYSEGNNQQFTLDGNLKLLFNEETETDYINNIINKLFENDHLSSPLPFFYRRCLEFGKKMETNYGIKLTNSNLIINSFIYNNSNNEYISNLDKEINTLLEKLKKHVQVRNYMLMFHLDPVNTIYKTIKEQTYNLQVLQRNNGRNFGQFWENNKGNISKTLIKSNEI